MRLSSRIALLSVLSAVLVLGTASLAAAKGGPKPPRANNPHAAEQQDAAQAAAAGQGAVTQQGDCQIPGLGDPVQGTGNLVLNPNGATNFVCHGQLPAGTTAPDRPVKVDLGDCDTVLTPSGRARTICHSKP